MTWLVCVFVKDEVYEQCSAPGWCVVCAYACACACEWVVYHQEARAARCEGVTGGARNLVCCGGEVDGGDVTYQETLGACTPPNRHTFGTRIELRLKERHRESTQKLRRRLHL